MPPDSIRTLHSAIPSSVGPELEGLNSINDTFIRIVSVGCGAAQTVTADPCANGLTVAKSGEPTSDELFVCCIQMLRFPRG